MIYRVFALSFLLCIMGIAPILQAQTILNGGFEEGTRYWSFRWWAGIIAAPLSGLVRVIILIILANIRAGFICLRVLNLSVVIIPTHYRLFAQSGLEIVRVRALAGVPPDTEPIGADLPRLLGSSFILINPGFVS
ncbi:hypothetical protein C2W62_23020 [Candidatus Entotheonella serta]|nr:hypothetical protein C2W62_23020 [Candidatus Entotheonella serta]